MAVRRSLVSAAAAFSVMASFAATGCSPGKDLTPKGTWVPVGHRSVNSLTSAEGVGTRANGSSLFRGLAIIPAPVRREGFNHIGDLDLVDGDILDSYQGPKWNSPKMFLVTLSDGKRIEYRHPLDPGEFFNNSFVTISPDKQWIVSGEFGVQKRLQVFPAPLFNGSTPHNGGTLRQAGQLALDHPVTNIQGCDFFSAQRLLCTSDDVKKKVFRVDLPHALNGKPITGKVTGLLTLPLISKCSGRYETEGIDYDPKTKIMQVQIVSPGLCKATTVVFSFRWNPDD